MTEGYYLYCIGDKGEGIPLDVSGVEKSKVMAIPFRSLSIIAHPVQTLSVFEEENKTMDWVQAHQSVVDAAWKRYNTVLPFAFGTIIRGNQTALEEWLKKEYGRLALNIVKVRHKAEYGAQIFWYPSQWISKVVEQDKKLKELQKKSQTKKSGTAYMYRQRLEKDLKRALEEEATKLFRKFFGELKNAVAEIAVEKIKTMEGEKQMLLNVSCLASRQQEEKLGDLLEEIQKKKEFDVRFTGPWPPYSFVSKS